MPHDEDMDMDCESVPFDECPPSVQAKYLLKMVKRLKAKRLSERDEEESARDDAAANAEREKQSAEYEKQKGAAPKIEVSDDDLPEDPSELEEIEDSSETEETKPKKSRKRK